MSAWSAAGYTGLSTALHLAQGAATTSRARGVPRGFGASGRNGGQVGIGQRREQVRTGRHVRPRSGASSIWDIAAAASDLVKSLIARHGIDAAWHDGVAYANWTAKGARDTRDYVEKGRREYDYHKAEPLDRDSIRALIGSDAFHGGMVDWGSGHLHPLRFALGLAQAAMDAGVTIHENTLAHHIQPGATPQVRTDKGRINADHIVLACNGYLGGLDPHGGGAGDADQQLHHRHRTAGRPGRNRAGPRHRRRRQQVRGQLLAAVRRPAACCSAGAKATATGSRATSRRWCASR